MKKSELKDLNLKLVDVITKQSEEEAKLNEEIGALHRTLILVMHANSDLSRKSNTPAKIKELLRKIDKMYDIVKRKDEVIHFQSCDLSDWMNQMATATLTITDYIERVEKQRVELVNLREETERQREALDKVSCALQDY